MPLVCKSEAAKRVAATRQSIHRKISGEAYA
jgi:hypothetical protein